MLWWSGACLRKHQSSGLSVSRRPRPRYSPAEVQGSPTLEAGLSRLCLCCCCCDIPFCWQLHDCYCHHYHAAATGLPSNTAAAAAATAPHHNTPHPPHLSPPPHAPAPAPEYRSPCGACRQSGPPSQQDLQQHTQQDRQRHTRHSL